MKHPHETFKAIGRREGGFPVHLFIEPGTVSEYRGPLLDIC